MSDEPTTRTDPDRFAALWRRLKEHRIAQWTVGYVAVAYGIQHAVTLTSEALDWPHAVTRVSILLLALGLPVAMTLAWYHGERASRGFSRAEFSILTTLLLGVSILFYSFVQPATRTVRAAAPAIQEAGVTAARQASLSPGTAISLAVMPFDNLSSDTDQGYFADGMTEEITTALAKIPDLTVVARESAFAFKGKREDVRAIGKALGATHLIEGTVRKAGDQLRISAQLVRGDTGATLWANSYDRQLKDVFAVQEDIARAIAASLHMTLPLKPGENLVSNRLEDPQVHELYLRALAGLKARDVRALDLVKQLLQRAPDFAPGWALQAQWDRAGRIIASRQGDLKRVASLSRDQESSARKAIMLDSQYVGGYAALASVLSMRGQWQPAADSYKKALDLDPNDSEMLNEYSGFLGEVGYLERALEIKKKLDELEPLVPIYSAGFGRFLVMAGKPDAAIPRLESLPSVVGSGVNYIGVAALAEAYAVKGRFADAADTLERSRQRQIPPQWMQDAARLLRSAPQKLPAAKLPELHDELVFVYAYVGAPERTLDSAEKNSVAGDYQSLASVWAPPAAEPRKTERFKNLARKAGLVDFWRKNGWPDLCHPTTGDDFECH